MTKKNKEKPIKVMDVVLVSWEDAVCNEAQCSYEHAKHDRPLMVHTAGLLIKDTKESVTLTSSYVETDEVKYTHTIPKTWVTKIEKLGSLSLFKEKR